jgi:hypothetical protein
MTSVESESSQFRCFLLSSHLCTELSSRWTRALGIEFWLEALLDGGWRKSPDLAIAKALTSILGSLIDELTLTTDSTKSTLSSGVALN